MRARISVALLDRDLEGRYNKRMFGGTLKGSAAVVAGAAALALALAAPAPAKTYRVTTTKDVAAECAPKRCSLRAAIRAAVSTSADDLIVLGRGTYRLSRAGASENDGETGDLDIPELIPGSNDPIGSLVIRGRGPARTAIVGDGSDRVIHLPIGDELTSPKPRVTIARLAIRGGAADNDGGGLRIDSNRVAVLQRARVSGNQTTSGSADGAGIENRGTLTVRRTTVAGNRAGQDGGGVSMNGNQGVLRVLSSTISGNRAAGDGGALYVPGGTATLANSTLSGNDAIGPSADGGGIYKGSSAALTAVHTTIAQNRAEASGGGLYLVGGSGEATLDRSLVAGNRTTNAASNCAGSGSVVSLGHNLETTDTCNLGGAGDRTATPARIGKLASNGGPTRTHALRRRSAAVNLVPRRRCTVGRDQRGVKRPQRGRRCDAGSFELR